LSNKIPKHTSKNCTSPKKPKLSRKEKRLLAKQDKEEKFNQKKEHLISNLKEVTDAKTPQSKSNPINSKNPDEYHTMKVEWDCKTPDIKGEWSWSIKRKQLIADKEEIHEFLVLTQSSTWNEILNQSSGGKKRIKKHHYQEVSSFISEAQKRWFTLYGEYDTAFRFRLGGKKRLWGYRIKNKFFVIWWDPTHKIYPL